MAWIRDAAEWLWAISPVKYTIISIVRLCLAALLGGIIGYEREHSHRPAGFRTHILVAVGSAVVMLTAVYMSERYPGKLRYFKNACTGSQRHRLPRCRNNSPRGLFR